MSDTPPAISTSPAPAISAISALSRTRRPHCRWRQIFRSNHLGHLTEADIEALRPLGLKSAFDFRGTRSACATCGLAEIAVHSLPIEPTVVAALRAPRRGVALSSADALDVMRDSYRNYVRYNTRASVHCLRICLKTRAAGDSLHRRQGSHRFRLRADPACACRAGRVIAEDYLLTNRFYRRDPGASGDCRRCQAGAGIGGSSFLAAAFEAISADYGDWKAISAKPGPRAGERAALEARYLEP